MADPVARHTAPTFRVLTAVASRTRHRRFTVSKSLPTAPKKGKVTFPGAQGGPFVKGWTASHFTQWLINSPEYDATVGALCRTTWDSLSERSRNSRAYTPLQLESVEALRRAKGFTTSSETRDWLAGDRGAGARRRLGFDQPTDHVHNRQRPKQQLEGEDPLRDGVPAEATLSRHRDELLAADGTTGEAARVAAWEACFALIVFNNLKEFEVLRKDALLLFGDGTGVKTHFEAPIYEKKTKKHRDGAERLVINAERITAPEAGYIPHSAGEDKGGHGWNIVSLAGAMGLPYCYRVIRRHDPEAEAALRLFKTQYQRVIAPWVRGRLSVFSADGAFHSQPLRAYLRSLNIVENIHLAGHSPGKRSTKEAATMDKATYGIRGHDHWCVNGHRELRARCAPDHQYISHRYRVTPKGRLRVFVQGNCTCGNKDDTVTITSGHWRMNSQGTEFVKCLPGEDAAWEMGNPLTYHSRLGLRFGRARWAYQEGLHGLLTTTYALLKHKRWFRRTNEVRLETAIVFCIMHIVAREALRQQGKSSTHATPTVANGASRKASGAELGLAVAVTGAP